MICTYTTLATDVWARSPNPWKISDWEERDILILQCSTFNSGLSNLKRVSNISILERRISPSPDHSYTTHLCHEICLGVSHSDHPISSCLPPFIISYLPRTSNNWPRWQPIHGDVSIAYKFHVVQKSSELWITPRQIQDIANPAPPPCSPSTHNLIGDINLLSDLCVHFDGGFGPK